MFYKRVSKNIKDYIGIKNSLRKLTDKEFNDIKAALGKQLSNITYTYNYTDDELNTDFKKLKNFSSSVNYTSSTIRVGMKLCEHFFPNFFKIQNKSKESFAEKWKNPKFLENVFEWNRKNHSTPYISELRRGVYFCGGQTKSTYYRPHIMKMILDKYDAKHVLDPCCGWGGRFLGTICDPDRYYIGFEPNIETYNNIQRMATFLNIKKYRLIHDGAEHLTDYISKHERIDAIVTSPPYFNLELYDANNKKQIEQYKTYDVWKTEWLFPLIKQATDHLSTNGISCWNVANIDKLTLLDDVIEYHKSLGFIEHDIFFLTNKSRPIAKKNSLVKKDVTVVFKKTNHQL